MKKLNLMFLIFILFVSFPIVLFAHPGRTDSNGGHYDRSTGEYHYHHGYPAHQHPNGVCPYADQASTSTMTSTNSSKEKSSSNKDTTTKNTSKSNSKNTSNKTSNINEENKENDNINVGDALLLGGIATVIGIGTIPNITSKVTNRNKNNTSKSSSSTTTENQAAEKQLSSSNNSSPVSTSKLQSRTSNYSYRCPRCGGSLRIKSGRYGKFLGCSNYPYCKYTRSINRKKKY